MSQNQSNLALVRECLAAARHDLSQAELRYRAQAVELALADDPKAGSDLRADIVAARQRADLLVVAVEVAEQAERDRLAGALTRAEKAQRRALKQQLAAIVERDAAGDAPDPETVAAQLARAGLDPKGTIGAAQAALDRAGSPVKATNLTAHALAQLAVMEKHFARHARSRPKS